MNSHLELIGHDVKVEDIFLGGYTAANTPAL